MYNRVVDGYLQLMDPTQPLLMLIYSWISGTSPLMMVLSLLSWLGSIDLSQLGFVALHCPPRVGSESS